MREISRLKIMLVVLMLGLGCLATAFAQPSEKEQGKPYRGKADELLKKMNLTPQQEAQIRELQQKNRAASRQLRGEAKGKRKELTDELEKPSPDAAKINALTAQLKDAEGRLIDQRVQSTLQMKKILTPEQYRTFTDTLKDMRKGQFGKTKTRRQQ